MKEPTENGKKTLTSQIRELEVGQTREFPAESAQVVKTLTYTYGFVWDRKYRTHCNRERRVLEVTRIS